MYVAEAHPTDGWYMRSEYELESHTSLDERAACARRLAARRLERAPPTRVLVDAFEPERSAANALGAHPERLFVVRRKPGCDSAVLEYVGGPGPFGYKPEQVEAWLEAAFGKQ